VARTEEVILPPTSPPVHARHARSTVLLGSFEALRASGRFDEYVGHLAPEHKDALLQAVAGTWIPMDAAVAHYAACDKLAVSHEQAFANGRTNFDKTGGALLGTVIRMAKTAGVTPWTLYPQFQRFWERAYDGGSVSIYKLGPKEARFEITHLVLLESPYYRIVLRGLVTRVIELFCTKAYIAERRHGSASVTWRVQWV
jgi:hypothetical protein